MTRGSPRSSPPTASSPTVARWWSGTGCWCALSLRRSRTPSEPGWARGASSPPGSTTSRCPTLTCRCGPRPTMCRSSMTPGSRWPPCASASSSTCRRRRRRRMRHARPAHVRPSRRTTRLVRGRACPQAAHSALHVVRHAAPPTAAGLRGLRLPRVGHGRVEWARHALLLRGRALSAGAGVRVPAADRAH